MVYVMVEGLGRDICNMFWVFMLSPTFFFFFVTLEPRVE